MTGPELVSIMIPVYNEAALLENRLNILTSALDKSQVGRYEVLICENGSDDSTLEVARHICNYRAQVRVISVPGPNYGRALKEGLQRASGEYLVVFGIDRFDVDFLKQGLSLIREKGFDIVIGSKFVEGSFDSRLLTRRLISRSFSTATRLLFGYQGTDVHGLKVLKQSSVLGVLSECRMDDVIFDTELLLSAQRKGLRICELPVTVREIRPSKYSLRKGGRVAKDMVILFYQMNIKKDKSGGKL